LIEEPLQARVGYFFPGEFAVLVFIEGHHLGDDGGCAVVARGIARGLGACAGGEDRQTDSRGRNRDELAHGLLLVIAKIVSL
jgi:hypothetical protein